jgi:hypothetical protein
VSRVRRLYPGDRARDERGAASPRARAVLDWFAELLHDTIAFELERRDVPHGLPDLVPALAFILLCKRIDPVEVMMETLPAPMSLASFFQSAFMHHEARRMPDRERRAMFDALTRAAAEQEEEDVDA